jgi:hypothetical protein
MDRLDRLAPDSQVLKARRDEPRNLGQAAFPRSAMSAPAGEAGRIDTDEPSSGSADDPEGGTAAATPEIDENSAGARAEFTCHPFKFRERQKAEMFKSDWIFRSNNVVTPDLLERGAPRQTGTGVVACPTGSIAIGFVTTKSLAPGVGSELNAAAISNHPLDIQ